MSKDEFQQLKPTARRAMWLEEGHALIVELIAYGVPTHVRGALEDWLSREPKD